MEKAFEAFCIRVKRAREDRPERAKVADWIEREAVLWVSRLGTRRVAEGTGISGSSLRVWRRRAGSQEGNQERMPQVIQVTRLSMPEAGPQQQVLARWIRGRNSIEFFDPQALEFFLEGKKP